MTQINTPLRAWFGDPDLKERVVLKLKKHRQQDEIVQGFYQHYSPTESGYKGCAVGCTLPSMYTYSTSASGHQIRRWGSAEVEEAVSGGAFHWLIQRYYGIEVSVASLIDEVFEVQETFEAAGDFAVAVIEAVPVGADLGQISRTFFEEDCIEEDRIKLSCAVNTWHGFPSEKAYYSFTAWRAELLINLLASAPVPEPV